MRATYAIAVVLFAGGCGGDRVVLQSADGSVRFALPCDASAGPASRSPEELAVLREHATRAMRHASDRERLSEANAMFRHYEAGDAPALEAAVATYLCANPSITDPGRIVFPDSGSLAPDFVLPVLAMTASMPADTLRLSQLRGKVVLLDFWASWCTGCKNTHPAVVALAKKYRQTDLVVLGVVFEDTPERARSYFSRQGGAGHAFVVDEAGALRREYQINGIPRMFLIDRDGTVATSCVYCAVGDDLQPSMLSRLEDLLGDRALAASGSRAPMAQVDSQASAGAL